MRRMSPCTRIMGGRPEDRCRSEALFLTTKARSSEISTIIPFNVRPERNPERGPKQMKEREFSGPPRSHRRADYVLNTLELASREAAHRIRDPGRSELQVCIQVNVSGEASKSGVDPAEAAQLAGEVAALPRLKLRGLMAVPEPTPDEALQRRRFGQLRELRDRLNRDGFAMDTLSMGMSADLEAAIAEGATLVRVGTAIFGERRD